MSAKKANSNNEKLNNLKELLREAGLSSRILAIYLDLHKGTTSNWNTNSTQPNLKDVDKIADLLEVDNQQIVSSKPRENTGLAKAVVDRYKKLIDEGTPLYINVADASSGKDKKVFNPVLVKALQECADEHKKKTKKKK